ncbi:ABC transporter permease subunit [Xanthocytophaga flava]|uniref:ABC transporter permease subunit n=1 Tax=Xanthocytophaga flava TaxID=3048013 RepID=UPI0028D56D2C|nr:ABC transporter permease subunit [Xanthocytophaga flavus]MDJ1472322.1 ABC transporter permease subunit [Xanthocytophaga flavus]
MHSKIIKYVLYDILRNKIVIAYTLFLFAVSLSLFQLEDNPSKAVLSLLNIILIVVPLVSVVFSTIHFYNSYEFIELLVAQPLPRNKILLSEYGGLAIAFSLAFYVGVGLPILFFSPNSTGFMLLLAGVILSLVFVSLAFLAAVITRDKAKGIGMALMVWFYFALLYDGLVLFILFAFRDYPLEKTTIALACLNPVDLGRILILLKMDVSALMGYTGAVYQQVLGNQGGILGATGIMLLWVVMPLGIAVSVFAKKDL